MLADIVTQLIFPPKDAVKSQMSKRANAPGNILLEKNEANLPKQSVVNVSQIFTVSKEQLQQKIGTISKARLEQILAGIQLVIEPRDV